jgi:FMN reductase (NADPH)
LTDSKSSLLDLFYKRKSIRKFSSVPLADADVNKIIEAGQRAPTACSLQTYAVIWTKNKLMKDQILSACTVPKSIKNVPVVFTICSDTRRLAKTLDHINADNCLKHGGGNSIKLMSILDASFVAQNMVMAAECLGLGSLFIGSAAANQKVIDILKLPENVIPLTLLLIGYPDEKPPTRPRLPMPLILHLDHYTDPTEKEIEESLDHMNKELDKEGYYQTYVNRGPDFHYADHIKRKTSILANKRIDYEIDKVMKRNGFLKNNLNSEESD